MIFFRVMGLGFRVYRILITPLEFFSSSFRAALDGNPRSKFPRSNLKQIEALNWTHLHIKIWLFCKVQGVCLKALGAIGKNVGFTYERIRFFFLFFSFWFFSFSPFFSCSFSSFLFLLHIQWMSIGKKILMILIFTMVMHQVMFHKWSECNNSHCTTLEYDVSIAIFFKVCWLATKRLEMCSFEHQLCVDLQIQPCQYYTCSKMKWRVCI